MVEERCELEKQFDFGEYPLISIHKTINNTTVSASYSRDAVNRSGNVYIFDNMMQVSFNEELSSASFHMDYLPQHDTAVMKLADGKIALLHTADHTLTYEKVDNKGVMITDVAYRPDDMNVGVFTDAKGRVTTFDRTSGDVLHVETAHCLYGMEVSAWCCHFFDENTFLTGGDDCVMKVHDLRTNSVVLTSEVYHGGIVRVRDYPSPFSVMIGAYDSQLRLLDTRNINTVQRSIPLEGDPWDFKIHDDDYISVAAMYGGWYILNGDFSVRVHQVQREKLIYGVERYKRNNTIESVVTSSFNDGVVSLYELCVVHDN
ncbi:unnamed protein product [Bursaphelenchus okinawaensis]|uniref:WD_REPEATS_REGION domain-containing protein n=1 Tax=Bursaphelenchus okinawaensis TaxID=465554 RepID=A0A811KGR3_9BILA|nr:unnamed protein product [Bursaphelenchus okinawaensis]CAG9104160.1 unnamed protein product [Bursaphelenchus okinawaensis]